MTEAFDLTRQARWEVEGTRRGTARYRAAADKSDANELSSGQRLLRECVPPLVLLIAEAQATPHRDINGDYLRLLPPDALALLTMTAVLRLAVPEAPLTNVANALASSIKDEVEFRTWAGEAKESDADTLRRFKLANPAPTRATWSRWRRKVQAARLDPWSAEVRLHLGASLVILAPAACPTKITVRSAMLRGKTQMTVCLTEEAQMLVSDIETRAEVARPVYMPMLIPPNPWRAE